MLTPEPAWGFEARLLTPAQWSFRDAMGRRLVLRCPSPSRLLKPALEYLYRGEEYERAARLVDWHTGITGGELRPVTVSIDRERSTAWAVQGWIQVSLSHGAPGRAAGLLGLLARLLAYTGTGKSRRIGLGMAETRAIPGRI